MIAQRHAASATKNDTPSSRAEVPDMSDSYDAYISSGLYDRRYPSPNRRTLRKLLRLLPTGGRFLDFGAGTGRYTLPLMQVTRANGVAYDICPAACRVMTERLGAFVSDGRLAVRNGDLTTLAGECRRSFDLVLLAFGVLGHVGDRAERWQLLQTVREMLKQDGVLILSLPNARRRFRTEQRAAAALVRAGELETGDILYTRGQGADEIRMFYHLFSLSEARHDLLAAGFQIESIEPESLLPEETVVGNPWLGQLDDMICRLAPATCGYGFLIVSQPRAAGAL